MTERVLVVDCQLFYRKNYGKCLQCSQLSDQGLLGQFTEALDTEMCRHCTCRPRLACEFVPSDQGPSQIIGRESYQNDHFTQFVIDSGVEIKKSFTLSAYSLINVYRHT